MLPSLTTRSIQLCLAIVALLGGLAGCASALSIGPEAEAKNASQERYAKAKALFEERCKTAGVTIKRTVKDVEGIELTKIRQPIPWGGKEYFDPMYSEAALTGEHRGDDYIKQFLMSEFLDDRLPERRGALGPPTKETPGAHTVLKRGYRFVEYLDPKGGSRLRCVPDWSRNHPNWVDGQHRCTPVSESQTRFALDYEDLLDPADRALWIAGTKLKVVDKTNGDVVAELTRYVWDAGLGSSTTARWPWEHANASGGAQTCPYQAGARDDISRKFIDTVLRPIQGD